MASSSSSATLKRWLRPEIYPLFAAVGVAVGICGMQSVCNISANPEVMVTKENRAAEHALRKLVRNRAPEIMPSINKFFTDPKY